MEHFSKFADAFAHPDRRYAVYPIVHGGAADPAVLERWERVWCGGVVGNIPYTHEFPNDDKAWNDTASALRASFGKGMHAWLYDENGYPSGTAGGYVTEFHPEFIARGLYCYDYWRPVYGPGEFRADVPGDTLWKALLVPIDGGDPIDVTQDLNERGVLYVQVPAGRYYLFMLCIRRLFDGTHATESYCAPRNYISMSDRAATRAFLDCTHENYKRVLGDTFGHGVLAMFTDEPSLISWNIRTAVFPILPWLDTYPDDFAARYGYPFYYACTAVVLNMGQDVIKRKCDFWEFIADTVADGYFAMIQDWCHDNNLKASGHLLEEESLQAHIINYGSFFRSMRRFDWPGIDQLNTEPEALMDRRSIPIARFVASFGDLNGEHEVFTEFSDHCVRERGEVAGKDCYYASVNWHLAMGVNNFTSYYSWATMDDAAITDFNHYTARSGYLLRQGTRDSRVAVFYPEAAMWACYTPTTRERARDYSEPMNRLERAFVHASWELLSQQIDYDYLDARLLLESRLCDGRLCFGDRSYDAIVMPCARVLETAAMEKLLAARAAGVTVLFVEEAPVCCRETGESVPVVQEIAQEIQAGKMFLAPAESFAEMLNAHLPPICRSITVTDAEGKTYHPMLLSHCRITEDGVRIAYITNMAKEDFTGVLHVRGAFSDAREADPFNGSMQTPSGCIFGAQETTLPITIRHGEGRFFLLQ